MDWTEIRSSPIKINIKEVNILHAQKILAYFSCIIYHTRKICRIESGERARDGKRERKIYIYI